MPRVLIADPLDANGIEILTKAGLEVDNRPGLKGDDLKSALRAADAVIARSQTKITAELLEEPGKLRAIARAGVGVDTIDVPAATRKGIVVMNTPGGNTVSAAEHTIALMMSLARRVPAADAVMKKGGWDRNKFVGTEVTGKTLGVIGLGRIGREVAKRAIGLEMKVVGYDPFVTPEKAAELGIKGVTSVEAMLPLVDFLTIHVPLTNETKSLLGAAELAKMKKTARVLNVARGGIIDEQALADALAAGTIAGAGIDVFSVEPTTADNPLLKAPNIVLTPHLGASTVEAQENVALEAAHLIADFLNKGIVANAVNMAAVDRKELDELRQYVDLARRLGLLHAQMCRGQIKKVTLTYKGDLAGRKTKLLTSAFTAGLLESRLAPGVNLVNAEVFARERGIEIVAVASPKKDDFASLMQADVETDEKTYTAAGTLFGNQYLRLVRLGHFRLEAYLDGVLFIFSHFDRPGLIGFVGTTFGKHGVNIAAMNLGRQTPGGEAIGVLNLDGLPPQEAVDAAAAHEHIASVSVVKLPPEGEMPAWLR
ncbi:phosphoglycerate dehydrogenase [Fimbriiglobus ruber]|uniref:D-3-phosphoglycerate dehydrogenase n=1 Tax=Fimbriiglobus ruber TaxID=1908690 RepID=A0A225DN40_9BACT|nr:phosphoglycerate dehydrogenase [Fimbriiglobus ruber]OWK38856.1 D-3-phosphoglycerate dehydrogenase [Fimbriiglobus ruber]